MGENIPTDKALPAEENNKINGFDLPLLTPHSAINDFDVDVFFNPPPSVGRESEGTGSSKIQHRGTEQGDQSVLHPNTGNKTTEDSEANNQQDALNQNEGDSALNQQENDVEDSPCKKPDCSMVYLLYSILIESPKRLSEIYQTMIDREDFYKHHPNPKRWQNSVRHNLSLQDCFVKVPRPTGLRGHGDQWVVHPLCCDMFSDSKHVRRAKKILLEDNVKLDPKIPEVRYILIRQYDVQVALRANEWHSYWMQHKDILRLILQQQQQQQQQQQGINLHQFPHPHQNLPLQHLQHYIPHSPSQQPPYLPTPPHQLRPPFCSDPAPKIHPDPGMHRFRQAHVANTPDTARYNHHNQQVRRSTPYPDQYNRRRQRTAQVNAFIDRQQQKRDHDYDGDQSNNFSGSSLTQPMSPASADLHRTFLQFGNPGNQRQDPQNLDQFMSLTSGPRNQIGHMDQMRGNAMGYTSPVQSPGYHMGDASPVGGPSFQMGGDSLTTTGGTRSTAGNMDRFGGPMTWGQPMGGQIGGQRGDPMTSPLGDAMTGLMGGQMGGQMRDPRGPMVSQVGGLTSPPAMDINGSGGMHGGMAPDACPGYPNSSRSVNDKLLNGENEPNVVPIRKKRLSTDSTANDDIQPGVSLDRDNS